MPYQPNFCAECGTRIIRESWHLWTSRRFCAACAPRLQRAQIVMPILLGLFLSGAGALAGYAWRTPPPPVVATLAAPNPARVTAPINAPPAPVTIAPTAPINTLAALPPDAEAAVSLCGARTRKGTPCTRRVHGTGRCFQHTGAPAMLPPEKLRLK